MVLKWLFHAKNVFTIFLALFSKWYFEPLVVASLASNLQKAIRNAVKNVPALSHTYAAWEEHDTRDAESLLKRLEKKVKESKQDKLHQQQLHAAAGA